MDEPPGSLEVSLDEWPVTEIWHTVAILLALWVPPREWPDVSGTPDTLEKALQVVGETLEQPSAGAAVGLWAVCFFQFCKENKRLCFMTQ